MINVLLMIYNGAEFVGQVIKSWSQLGPVHVFIDEKTTDNTEALVRSLGIQPRFFRFIDFATSRNAILSQFPDGYRIFIDDSYIFHGEPGTFISELMRCGCDVIGMNILMANEWTVFSKITRGPCHYVDRVHEYINRPRQYTMQSGFIEELDSREHTIRRLKRFAWDVDILLGQWYANPRNERATYYLCRTFLICFKYGLVPKRLVIYWLTQLSTRHLGHYTHFGKSNSRILKSLQ